MDLKDKIALNDITAKDEQKYLQQTVNLLNKNDKDIKKLMTIFEKQPAQVRAFLAETFLHIVLASSRLSPTVIIAVLEKIKTLNLNAAFSQGLATKSNTPEKQLGNYVG
jgi:hypothetical protein